MSNPDYSRVSRRGFVAGVTATAFAGLSAGDAPAKAPMANAQAPAFYRFRLGGFQLTVLSDGPLHLGPPQAGVFSDTTKEDMGKALADNYLPGDNVSLSRTRLWSIPATSSFSSIPVLAFSR